MKCHEIEQYLDSYWQMDEDDSMRIEIEAHLLECEFCMRKLGLDDASLSFANTGFTEHYMHSHDESYINRTVMDRIYADEKWYMPIASKSYKFSKVFRRNAAIIIACCLAMCTLALFVFVFDYATDAKQTATAQISGVVDIATATNDSFVTSSIYKGQVPVASISDPFVMQVVPTFPQYYVALSLLGIIMTILVINWFARTKT